MKKFGYICAGILFFIGIFLSTRAASKAAEEKEMPTSAMAFLNIPETDLDILAPSQRNEMIIYMMNDSIYKRRNIFSGLSWIEKMTPDYMKVHLTDVSSLQIKILPQSKSKNGQNLVMTIYTIAGETDTADSTIKFYNMNVFGPDSIAIAELPSRKFFTLPDPKKFYNEEKIKTDGEHLSEMMQEMPFHTIAYEISEEGNTLTGKLTIDNYLTTEQRDRIDPYLIRTLRWQWNGKKFN